MPRGQHEAITTVGLRGSTHVTMERYEDSRFHLHARMRKAGLPLAVTFASRIGLHSIRYAASSDSRTYSLADSPNLITGEIVM